MNIPLLESFILDKMAATRLPGLSITLIKGDQVVYSRGFGHADPANSRAATDRTLYGAASITKSFAAISILQLGEKGLLKVDDPVDRHITWPVASPHGPVRIEHLLAHTSGLPALGYIEAILRYANGIGGCPLPIAGSRDVLTFMRGADDWVHTAPGQRWFYLNEGYVVLGEIIAKLSGQTFEQYVTDHILKPLGMTRSFFSQADVARDGDLAVPYILPSGGPPRAGRYVFGDMGADAALITNTADLGRYVSMLIDRGRGMLSESSWSALTQPRTAMAGQAVDGLISAPPLQYAFGLHIEENFFGQPLLGHGGSVVISMGNISFLPQSRIGVAVLTNGNGYAMGQLSRYALALMLDEDPRKLAFARTDRLMADLPGQYASYRGTVRVKVKREGDFLRMEWISGDQAPGAVTLVPDRIDDGAGASQQFFTYSEGRKLPVEFRRTPSGPGVVEFTYERYKFRRTGPL